jgi:opacity protein-like surface antigen
LFAWPEAGHCQGFYVNGEVGPALAENVSLQRFVVPTPGAKIELDAGVRVSVAGGYNFNDYVGAEIETGFIFNEVQSVTGLGNIDAAVGHVPLLANVVLRYDRPNCKWVPYAGAGVGGDASLIALDYVTAPNGAVVDGEASTVVFAWQSFAGVRYKITDKISVGASFGRYPDGQRASPYVSGRIQHEVLGSKTHPLKRPLFGVAALRKRSLARASLLPYNLAREKAKCA